jgi:D-beta-D-heptose 7-phosphate kinase/D-beta-D-heptose 1-phosphate adenosyltransferase
MYDNLIITQGKKGCIYRGVNYSVDPVEVKDVSGAGDTFISGLCCEFLKTRDIKKSIIFANECATKVVQKRGVSTI